MMTQNGKTQIGKGFEFTGWHMLAVMVGFFAIVIGVNLTLAVASSRTWTGLVVENSYVASQQFNDKLAIARNRTAAGWQGALAYANGQLRFTLVDAEGDPVALDGVSIEVSRPVGIKGDRTVDLTPAVDGSHVIAIALEPGVWNAAILAHVPGAPDYEHRARLLVD